MRKLNVLKLFLLTLVMTFGVTQLEAQVTYKFESGYVHHADDTEWVAIEIRVFNNRTDGKIISSISDVHLYVGGSLRKPNLNDPSKMTNYNVENEHHDYETHKTNIRPGKSGIIDINIPMEDFVDDYDYLPQKTKNQIVFQKIYAKKVKFKYKTRTP